MLDFVGIDTKINITIGSIVVAIIWLVNFLYKKNNAYYTLIKEFRSKLPRPQNSAKPHKSSIMPPFTTLNLSTHKTSITESEIDTFYNTLIHFDYDWVLYKKHYQSHANNLFRFNPKAMDKNFDLVMVQHILNNESLYPLKPINVLIFHLKFKHKITSNVYLYFFSKRNTRVL